MVLAEPYDVVFVGAGASTSYVLLALLTALGVRPPARPLRIGVVERDPDPFPGTAYGRRAARTSLLITPLRDFLPDQERAVFTAWLAANKHWVFDEFLADRGPLSTRWWARHRVAIEHDDFEGLYLPRYTFGVHLAQRLWSAIAAAEASGTATADVLQDEVLAVRPDGGHHRVTCTHDVLRASHVVLGTGSPPVMSRLHGPAVRSGLVEDPFAGMAEAAEHVRAAMRATDGEGPPHVVLIGGNAGTMDMLYQLNDSSDREQPRTVFTVLSPRGELPARVDDAPPLGRAFEPQLLEALVSAPAVTATVAYDAALGDIERGREEGLSAADTLRPISLALGRVLPRLAPEEALEFAGCWGAELGRHQRRAGWEYWEVVENLRAEGRFRLLAATFHSVHAAARGTVRVRYKRAGTLHELDPPAVAVVNCAGPARDLTASGVPLLTQLIGDAVCRTTRSGAGIAVDDSLAAAPGLYVMGPLLAGNLVRGRPLWHLEHCGRISSLGTEFGTELARRVEATLSPEASATVG